MGTTKTEHFTEKQSEIAVIAKAMGHPARVAIIDLLLKVNACIGNDILEKNSACTTYHFSAPKSS